MRIRTFATVVIAAAAILGFAAPAFAHDALESATPAAGTVVATAPADISFTFAESALDMGNKIVVTDASGTDWVDGEVVVADRNVSAALKSGMADGVYTVLWRVVSSDGHPVSGTYVFGVGAAADLQSQVDAASAALIQPADEDAEVTATAVTTNAPADNVWLTVAIAVGGAALAIALFWSAITIIRKRQQ